MQGGGAEKKGVGLREVGVKERGRWDEGAGQGREEMRWGCSPVAGAVA